MNKASLKILEKIFKRCNCPDGLLQSLPSIPISSSRFPDYHQASTKLRLQTHKELGLIESSVAGFNLEFSSSGFGDVPLLKKVHIKNCRALLLYCKEPIKNESIYSALEDLNAAEPQHSDWSQAIIADIEQAWLNGKTAYGCSIRNVDKLIDALKLLNWHENQTETFQKDIRTLSVFLYGDTKRLEVILPIVAKLFASKTPEALQAASPQEIMFYWGISKFPPAFQLKAALIINTRKGHLHTGSAWPYLQVPPDGIEGLSCVKQPEYILFIENKTTFERYTREIDDKGWVFYTHGFPSRQWQSLFKQVVDLCSEQVPVFHWGDLDMGGYRILVFMANLLQCNLRPFMMFQIEDGLSDKRIELKALVGILSGVESRAILDLRKRILQVMQQQSDVGWLEQEALGIRSPLLG